MILGGYGFLLALLLVPHPNDVGLSVEEDDIITNSKPKDDIS